MHTLASLVDRHGVDVLEHLDRDASVPYLAGLQFQGDIAVVPAPAPAGGQPIPAAGVPVVRGEDGGNTHLLLADGPGATWSAARGLGGPLVLGYVAVPEGSAALLAHPEHGYCGIAPGTYEIRRQREQADEIRMVAD